MNQIQLPAYLQNRQAKGGDSLAQRSLAVVGTGAGPYMSLRDNRFTLIDSAGNQQPFQTLYADVIIVDVNEHMSKDYRVDDWDPDNMTPPVCFSDNGIAPSTGAASPQSPTCGGCQWNVWGSKISKMGSKVKACRDTVKTAIVVPGFPNQMFRLVVAPNSLVNFRAYLAKFQNAGFDLPDVITRLSFEQGVQGTLLFDPAPNPWLDENTLAIRDQALASKASDMLVGRTDRPRQGMLAAPVQQAQETSALPPASSQTNSGTHGAGAPGALSGYVQTAAFPTATAPPQTQTAAPAQAASPSSPPQAGEPTRRRRRTQAEMATANPPAAGQQANGPAPGPAMAPFRPAAPDAAPAAGNPGAFGIQAGVAPNPELAMQIKSIFG